MATDTTGLYEDLLKQAFLHREMEGERKTNIEKLINGLELDIHVHGEKDAGCCSVSLRGSALGLVAGVDAVLTGVIKTINDIENEPMRKFAMGMLLDSILKCLLDDAAKGDRR